MPSPTSPKQYTKRNGDKAITSDTSGQTGVQKPLGNDSET